MFDTTASLEGLCRFETPTQLVRSFLEDPEKTLTAARKVFTRSPGFGVVIFEGTLF